MCVETSWNSDSFLSYILHNYHHFLQKLNPWNKKGDTTNIQVSDVKSRLSGKAGLDEVPDKKFYLAMDFNKIDNYHFHDVSFYPISAVNRPNHLYMPQINHLTTKLPSSPPLTQYSDIDEVIYFKIRYNNVFFSWFFNEWYQLHVKRQQ